MTGMTTALLKRLKGHDALVETLKYIRKPDRALDVRIALAVGHNPDDVHGRRFVDVCAKYGWQEMGDHADSWRVPEYTAALLALAKLTGESPVAAAPLNESGVPINITPEIKQRMRDIIDRMKARDCPPPSADRS